MVDGLARNSVRAIIAIGFLLVGWSPGLEAGGRNDVGKLGSVADDTHSKYTWSHLNACEANPVYSEVEVWEGIDLGFD